MIGVFLMVGWEDIADEAKELCVTGGCIYTGKRGE